MAVTVAGNLFVAAAVVASGLVGAEWSVLVLPLSAPTLRCASPLPITCPSSTAFADINRSRRHIGFPIFQRAVWGMRLAWFPLCSASRSPIGAQRPEARALTTLPPLFADRIILSFTWCATQGWFGGQVVKTLLGALAPSIYSAPLLFLPSSTPAPADPPSFPQTGATSSPRTLASIARPS